MLKFHPYFILTGETTVGFVMYCVLIRGYIMPTTYNCPHLIWKFSAEPEHNTIIMYMPTHTYMLLAEGLYYRRTIQFKNRDWGDLLIRGWNWTKGPSLYNVRKKIGWVGSEKGTFCWCSEPITLIAWVGGSEKDPKCADVV